MSAEGQWRKLVETVTATNTAVMDQIAALSDRLGKYPVESLRKMHQALSVEVGMWPIRCTQWTYQWDAFFMDTREKYLANGQRPESGWTIYEEWIQFAIGEGGFPWTSWHDEMFDEDRKPDRIISAPEEFFRLDHEIVSGLGDVYSLAMTVLGDCYSNRVYALLGDSGNEDYATSQMLFQMRDSACGWIKTGIEALMRETDRILLNDAESVAVIHHPEDVRRRAGEIAARLDEYAKDPISFTTTSSTTVTTEGAFASLSVELRSGHPLHDEMVSFLQMLPECEISEDDVGGKTFRNSPDNYWYRLVNNSRHTAQVGIEKLERYARKLAEWIRERFCRSGDGEVPVVRPATELRGSKFNNFYNKAQPNSKAILGYLENTTNMSATKNELYDHLYKDKPVTPESMDKAVRRFIEDFGKHESDWWAQHKDGRVWIEPRRTKVGQK